MAVGASKARLKSMIDPMRQRGSVCVSDALAGWAEANLIMPSLITHFFAWVAKLGGVCVSL